MLLAGIAEPLSQKAARADGEQRLYRLPRLVSAGDIAGIDLHRVQPHIDAFLFIMQHENGEKHRRRAEQHDEHEIAQAAAADEHQYQSQHANEDRAGKVRLQKHQPAGHHEDAEQRQKAAGEGADAFIVQGNKVGKQQNE